LLISYQAGTLQSNVLQLFSDEFAHKYSPKKRVKMKQMLASRDQALVFASFDADERVEFVQEQIGDPDVV